MLEVLHRARTLSMFFSKANSGACTPITTRPWSLYFSCPGADVRQRAQAVDAGVGPEIDQHDLAAQRLRRQRRRVEPRRPRRRATAARLRPAGGRAGRRGLAAIVMLGCRSSASSWPPPRGSAACATAIDQASARAGGAGERHARQQAGVEPRARSPRRAAAPATPSPRRTHSPAPSERFIAANTRPPTSSASASEVAAPAA